MIGIFLSVVFIFILNFEIIESVREAGVHQCVHATRKLGKNGDGSAESSCMSCDPARPQCYYSCQDLIDLMYLSCDGVCLPDGYYFDAAYTMEGCWNTWVSQIRVEVNKCGCSSASRLFGSNSSLLAVTTILVVTVILFFFDSSM